MSSFDKWAGDLADHISGKTTKPVIELDICQELKEYNEGNEDGDDYYYPCRVCGKVMFVDDPERFNPDMSYCGGSPSCCP